MNGTTISRAELLDLIRILPEQYFLDVKKYLQDLVADDPTDEEIALLTERDTDDNELIPHEEIVKQVIRASHA